MDGSVSLMDGSVSLPEAALIPDCHWGGKPDKKMPCPAVLRNSALAAGCVSFGGGRITGLLS
jgi:hypothetical protein